MSAKSTLRKKPKREFIDMIIVETPDAPLIDLARGLLVGKSLLESGFTTKLQEVEIPAAATRNGIPQRSYHIYRRGLMSACADVVCVRDVGGRPEVPLISRTKPPFQGGWFVQGGAIFNYRLIPCFALWKLLTEARVIACDMDVFLESEFPYGLSWRGMVSLVPLPLGVYRTAAGDNLPGEACDTLNIAYLALLSDEFPFGYDSDHTAVRWVTLPELLADSNLCGHWYPQHLAIRALQIVMAANQIS
ncbi:MAG: hypothetical protein HYS73_00785 [Parcubacteria group bacterium]|nr:hypothetical protein [Parcubacteria group bacterium]